YLCHNTWIIAKDAATPRAEDEAFDLMCGGDAENKLRSSPQSWFDVPEIRGFILGYGFRVWSGSGDNRRQNRLFQQHSGVVAEKWKQWRKDEQVQIKRGAICPIARIIIGNSQQ